MIKQADVKDFDKIKKMFINFGTIVRRMLITYMIPI